MALYVYYTGYLYFAIAGKKSFFMLYLMNKLINFLDKQNLNNYKATSSGFVQLYNWYYVGPTLFFSNFTQII